MSKTWDTKNRIIEMLAGKKMTLTEISEKLDLAPSTVNQHIKELLQAGAIRQVPNPFILKWKYYEANPGFSGGTMGAMKERNIMNAPIFKALGAVVIVAIVAGLLLGTGIWLGGTAVNAQQNLAAGTVPAGVTLMSLSDSPTVSTIGAVNVTVYGAEIHSTTTGKWYTVFNGSKTFDLVRLRNISAVLSGANLSAGNYDEIVLEVGNATATVNNATMPVFMPSGDLKIFGKFNVSKNTTNWVNLDFNLSKSVRVTGNGKVVLLPVINMLASRGANLSLSSNGIVNVSSHGKAEADEYASMDVNGTMQQNTTDAAPLGQPVEVNGEGKVIVVSNPHIGATVIVSTEHNIIILTNATNVTGVLPNLTANMSVQVVGPNSRSDSSLKCESSDNAVTCSAHGDVKDSVLANVIANSSNSLFGGFGENESEHHTNQPVSINANITVNESEGGNIGIGSSRGGGHVTVNVSVDGGRNVTANPSYPPWVNSSFLSCTTDSQCAREPLTFCQNGMPQQSICVNQQYAQQYLSAYGQNVANTSSHICPMVNPAYVINIPVHCGCVENTCTVLFGSGGEHANSSINESASTNAGVNASAVGGLSASVQKTREG